MTIEPAAASRTGAGTRPSLLLVDDRPENLLVMEAILRDLDVELVKVTSGREALKVLLDRDVAAILLDVMMAGMDGFETAALIRDRERSKHTPILFLTAFHKSEQHLWRGYTLGAVDYMVKPLVPEVLRSKVAVFVEVFRKAEREATRARFFALSGEPQCLVEGGAVREVNPAFAEALGREAVACEGRLAAALFREEDRDTVARALAGAAPGGEPATFTASLASGARFAWRSVALAPGRAALLGWPAPRPERSPLSVLAHELRTPLASLTAGLRLVSTDEGGRLDGRAHKALLIALRSCARLAALVDEAESQDPGGTGPRADEEAR